MCSFIYGCALSEPILGPYFELPKKQPQNRNLIYDKSHRHITDVRNHLFHIGLFHFGKNKCKTNDLKIQINCNFFEFCSVKFDFPRNFFLFHLFDTFVIL